MNQLDTVRFYLRAKFQLSFWNVWISISIQVSLNVLIRQILLPKRTFELHRLKINVWFEEIFRFFIDKYSNTWSNLIRNIWTRRSIILAKLIFKFHWFTFYESKSHQINQQLGEFSRLYSKYSKYTVVLEWVENFTNWNLNLDKCCTCNLKFDHI